MRVVGVLKCILGHCCAKREPVAVACDKPPRRGRKRREDMVIDRYFVGDIITYKRCRDEKSSRFYIDSLGYRWFRAEISGPTASGVTGYTMGSGNPRSFSSHCCGWHKRDKKEGLLVGYIWSRSLGHCRDYLGCLTVAV